MTRTRTAVYRYYDATGRLLYIGAATNPDARGRAHKLNFAWWWPLAASRTDEWFPTRDEALDAEAAAISAEKPLANRLIPRPVDLPDSGPFIMGAAEIAAALNVNRQRVHQLSMRPDFPQPVQVIAAGKIWLREDIQKWAAGNRTRIYEFPSAFR